LPFKLAVGAAIGVFALLLVMISPLFAVRQVLVEGNTVITTEAVLTAAGLNAKANIFAVMPGRAVKALQALPYVKSARIVKEYPNTIRIVIEERKAQGYVEFTRMSTYLMIDGEGMVLGTQAVLTDALPVIVGLEFSDFAVGRVLETTNQTAFDTVVQLSRLFAKNEMEDIVRVDISDANDIHLYVQNVDVLFGNMDYADVKVQILKELAANHIPADYRGFMDMRFVSDKADLEKISLRPLR